MMDIYEAIERTEDLLTQTGSEGYGFIVLRLDDEDVEAIKVCLEAARDKAGV